MKRILLICFFFASVVCQAQTYEALNYSLNATPVNGVNIRTNLPYTNASQMVTLKIEGYNYGAAETISLNVVYYIYNGAFIQHSISSAGGYTPDVWLSNNSGFVNVFINDKSLFQRFKVTAFAKGITEQAAWFQGWTAVDEVMQGTNTVQLLYKNNFKGTLTNLGNTLLLGNVGVGTSSPTEKLSVKGKIRAQEVKVEMANWSDFVFAEDYVLPTLAETEKHIKEKGHLPGIPSAAEVEKNGIELGEMNKKLLQKIEELTLYLIRLNKVVNEQSKEIQELKGNQK